MNSTGAAPGAGQAVGGAVGEQSHADDVVVPPHAPTVPDEDFFSLIQRLQAGRLEDQRATLPTSTTAHPTS